MCSMVINLCLLSSLQWHQCNLAIVQRVRWHIHSKTPILLVTCWAQWIDSDSVVKSWWLPAAQWLHCHWQAQLPCCRQLRTVTAFSLSSHHVVTLSSRWLMEYGFCCAPLLCSCVCPMRSELHICSQFPIKHSAKITIIDARKMLLRSSMEESIQGIVWGCHSLCIARWFEESVVTGFLEFVLGTHDQEDRMPQLTWSWPMLASTTTTLHPPEADFFKFKGFHLSDPLTETIIFLNTALVTGCWGRW